MGATAVQQDPLITGADVEGQADVTGWPSLHVAKHHHNPLGDREVLEHPAKLRLPLCGQESLFHRAVPGPRMRPPVADPTGSVITEPLRVNRGFIIAFGVERCDPPCSHLELPPAACAIGQDPQHVRSDERRSKRGSPRRTAIHVSCTTSSAIARVGTKRTAIRCMRP